jgi:hypothetical protein
MHLQKAIVATALCLAVISNAASIISPPIPRGSNAAPLTHRDRVIREVDDGAPSPRKVREANGGMPASHRLRDKSSDGTRVTRDEDPDGTRVTRDEDPNGTRVTRDEDPDSTRVTRHL